MDKDVFKIMQKYTKHRFISLTSRGNKAILAGIRAAKERNPGKIKALTVDQGGWLTYLQYPKKLKMKLDFVKTDYGVIDLEDLKKKSLGSCFLLYSNPAGYYASQPMKDIYRICDENGCLVIMDVTGSIGSELCDGNYADILVGSFGKAKPVNLGYGGFISSKEHLNIKSDFDEKLVSELKARLHDLSKRYRIFEDLNQKIKKDLNSLKILHPEKRGINVIVRFDTESEKQMIEEYCNNNGIEYTICPRYIRVKEKAVSIEVKRAG